MALKPATHPKAVLHKDPHTGFWVARDLDDYSIVWTWTIYRESWMNRTLYQGAVDSLPVHDAWHAFATGWPGARPLAKEPAERRGRPMQFSTSEAVYTWIVNSANANGMTVSAFLHARVEEMMRAAQPAADASSAASSDA